MTEAPRSQRVEFLAIPGAMAYLDRSERDGRSYAHSLNQALVIMSEIHDVHEAGGFIEFHYPDGRRARLTLS